MASRDFTFSSGTWVRLSINDSVRPSLRKSASALPPTLANGITAMDSICDGLDLARQYQIPPAAITMNKTTTAVTQYFPTDALWVAVGSSATHFPDSASLLRRFKSARSSAADW